MGAIRRIWATNEQHLAKPHGQMFVDNGKFVIATLGDHDQAASASAGWITNCQNWARVMSAESTPAGPCTMIELINEPFEKYWSATGTDYPKYWNRIREAAPIMRAAGLEVVLGLPPTGGDRRFLNQAAAEGDIFDLIDGLALHPYSTDPGTMVTRTGNTTVGSDVITNMSSTAGLSVGQKVQGRGIPNLLGGTNPATGITAIGPGLQITISDNASQTHAGTTFGFGSAGSQVMWMMARRAQVENAGGGAENLWFWITEFGWGTQRYNNYGPLNLYTGPPQGAPPNPTNASEQEQEDKLTQAYTNWETHAGAMKLRAAAWYWLRDYSNAKTTVGGSTVRDNGKQGTFQYCGLRTDESDPALGPTMHNPAPWRWKNVTPGDNPQNPTTGIKAALDSFGWGATIGGGGVTAAPDAITLTPATSIEDDSAVLEGTVDPNNLQTQWHYEYSLSPLSASDPLAWPAGTPALTNSQASGMVVTKAEQRSMNIPENATMANLTTVANWRATIDFLPTAYKNQVNGQYIGTTDEIIQWAARKWRFHPDILRAVACNESWWDQHQLGDPRPAISPNPAVSTTTVGSHDLPVGTINVVSTSSFTETVERIIYIDPPGSAPAEYMTYTGTTATSFTGCAAHDFKPGTSIMPDGSTVRGTFDSYGIFQMKRYPTGVTPALTWTTPHIALVRDHTAFVADFYGAILRAYIDGAMTWLSAYDPPTGPNLVAYGPNDLWGSVGAWFSGRFHDASSASYRTSAQNYYNTKPWLGGGF